MSEFKDPAEAVSEMKRSLWIGIFSLVGAGVIAWLISVEFSRANDLLERGTVGVATAISNSRSVTGSKGKVSHVTEVSIGDIKTTVGLKTPISAGESFRIIYSAPALAKWNSHRKGWFYSYMVGEATMSASALVEQKLGETYTIGRWAVAALGLGALYLFFDYFRIRRTLSRRP